MSTNSTADRRPHLEEPVLVGRDEAAGFVVAMLAAHAPQPALASVPKLTVRGRRQQPRFLRCKAARTGWKQEAHRGLPVDGTQIM